MTARFIVRLLDAAGALLAWAEVTAAAQPQDRAGSCPFWPTGPTEFVIDAAGAVTQVAIHWPDLDVARLKALPAPVPVQPGERRSLPWTEPIWLVAGMRDVPLPPVTVKGSVAITVPIGTLNAIDSRL